MGEPEDLIFKRFAVTLDELQKMALDSNPTLKAMKTMIEAKEKAHGLARLDYYPDFTFKFAYGQRDNGPEMKQARHAHRDGGDEHPSLF